MFLATLMDMFVKFIGTLATFALADVVIYSTTEFLTCFSRIGVRIDATHITDQKI